MVASKDSGSQVPVVLRVVASRRWPQACVLAIAIGMMVRFAAAFVLMPAAPELNEYGIIAQNIAEGRSYSYFAESAGAVRPNTIGTPIPSSFMGPGFTYSVALARSASNGDEDQFRLALGSINFALSSALVLAVYAAGRQLAGHRAGLTAGALVACYPTLALLPSLGSAANFYLPSIVLVAVGAIALSRNQRILGVSILLFASLWLWSARSEAPVFVAAAVAAAALGSTSRKRVLLLGLATLGGSAIVMSAVWFQPRTSAMDHPLLSTTTTVGYNLWLGNGSGASGSQKRPPPDFAELAGRASRLPASPDYEFRHDDVFLDRAIADIHEQPVQWAVLLGKKALMAATFDPYDGRAQLPLVAVSTLTLLAVAAVVLGRFSGVALVGPDSWPHLALAAVQVLISTFFFVLNRYKLNVDVPLLILTGAGLVAIDSLSGLRQSEVAPVRRHLLRGRDGVPAVGGHST